MPGIDFTSDLHDAVTGWMEAFISETSLDRYRRACAWTASEVAKAAYLGATDAIDHAFDDPTPWMRRAFGYTRAINRTGDAVEASLFTKPDQSIVLKYGMGDGRQARRPGDVGLARDRIYVPHWKNLQTYDCRQDWLRGRETAAEATAQIAAAHTVVLTKTDCVDAGSLAGLAGRVGGLNPLARIVVATDRHDRALQAFSGALARQSFFALDEGTGAAPTRASPS